MEKSATMIKAKTKPKKRRKAKKRAGPLLTRLAEEMGVSVSTVWRWENDGIPGSGPLKDWREQHFKAALAKLEEKGAA